MLYLNNMENRNMWYGWARKLHLWGIAPLVGLWFDVAAPLNIIGAQFVHILEPVLQGFVSEQKLDAIAALLEDPSSSREFAEYINKEDFE